MTMTDPAPDKTGKNTSLPAEDTKTAKDTALPDLNHGLQIIRDMARRLDTSPGVYRMLGHDGQVLYVGKAKGLKSRVLSYTRANGLSHRLTRMVAETRSMEIITTRTEVEALLLESNLIKTLKPRFNILLRDDKSFPYIMITRDHEWAQINKHRGSRKRKAWWFGPFASANAVNRTVTELTRAFLLRNCSDSIFSARTRPCLQYQIKRCTAPCAGKISKEDYQKQVDQAVRFLNGESRSVQDEFATYMQAAAEELRFEDAALWRNRIRALTMIQAHQDINLPGELNADIIAFTSDSGRSCVQVFFMRNGSNFGNRAYFPRHDKDDEPAAIIAAFIGQFYDDKPPPPDIFVNHAMPEAALITEALSNKAGRKVQISVPARGQRRKLMANAERNAREALARELTASSTQKKMLDAVQELFDLDERPGRIEVYDNSHIQGSHAVGAMIVAGEDGFMKPFYRKFNIDKDKTDTEQTGIGGDDYAMMREVLTRRFSRAIREDPDRETGIWPDLVLLDGGKGQLSTAREVMNTLGITDVPMVAISKGVDRNAGREEFHQTGKDSFNLPHHTPVLHFLQRLRDEAHRFAIGAHRTRRSAAQKSNPLDDIPGIGAYRKKSLLTHFGSARAVANADIPDLMKVNGISQHVADIIYHWFHDKS